MGEGVMLEEYLSTLTVCLLIADSNGEAQIQLPRCLRWSSSAK